MILYYTLDPLKLLEHSVQVDCSLKVMLLTYQMLNNKSTLLIIIYITNTDILTDTHKDSVCSLIMTAIHIH